MSQQPSTSLNPFATQEKPGEFNRFSLEAGKFFPKFFIRDMNKWFLQIAFFLLFFSTQAWSQVKLWGVTSEGGKHQSGTIFYLHGDGSGFTKVHDFDGKTGHPFSSLTFFDGNIWGMTAEGGIHNQGVIFHISKNGAVTKVHDFYGPEGANPRNSLLFHQDMFFGITSRGGDAGLGTIFTIKTDGTWLRAIYHFDKGLGKPESGLIFSHGKLWGITTTGGKRKEGAIFSINPDGSGIRFFHDLAYPTLGDFIKADDTLFAMMSLRGDSNCGTIFTIKPKTSNHQTIHAFDCNNGRFPEGNLIESQNQL